MNLHKALFSLSSAALLLGTSACQMQPQGPYETGLTVVQQAEQVRTTQVFTLREDGELMERKATLGSGASCNEARGSAGTLTVTETGVLTTTWNVIGQTESQHPLVPGAATYGPVGVSVTESTSVFEGTATTHETFRDPDGSPDAWEETTTSEVARATAASYEGIAADEYVVGLSSLGDLWTSLDDPEAQLSPRLVTRNNAQPDDIWASVDGNTLYMAEGMDEVSVGGEKGDGRRVTVLAVGDAEPDTRLLGACVQEVEGTFETTHPDQGDGTVWTAHLDPGCDVAFTHEQLGTEWWVGNVLIEAEKEYADITITDYGYEWFEDNGNSCTRVTSPTRDDSDAQLYIEFTKTTIVETMKTPKYEIVSSGGDSEE